MLEGAGDTHLKPTCKALHQGHSVPPMNPGFAPVSGGAEQEGKQAENDRALALSLARSFFRHSWDGEIPRSFACLLDVWGARLPPQPLRASATPSSGVPVVGVRRVRGNGTNGTDLHTIRALLQGPLVRATTKPRLVRFVCAEPLSVLDSALFSRALPRVGVWGAPVGSPVVKRRGARLRKRQLQDDEKGLRVSGSFKGPLVFRLCSVFRYVWWPMLL